MYSNNALTLAAGAANTLTAGIEKSGVCVEDTTVLTINGRCVLITTCSLRGADIGGGYYVASGDITISGESAYADGQDSANDIGIVEFANTNGSLSISSTAAVFLVITKPMGVV